MPLQRAPQIPVLSPPLETARRRKGARVGGVGNRGSEKRTGTAFLLRAPGDRSEGKPSPEKQRDRTPKGAAGRPGAQRLSGEGKGVGLHETAARPAGDKPNWGRWNKEGQGKEASPEENGETESGKGVIREGVEENPRREGEPGRGYLLGVCPPAVPPESG